MGRMISDEVWDRLDSDAGALGSGTVRRVRGAVAVAVLVAVTLGVAWQVGLVIPRFTASANQISTTDNRFEVPVTITNRNAWAEVSVEGAGRSGAGLELIRVANLPARSLAPGQSATLTLVYRVTDCAAVPDGPWPVPVRVARWWGTQTIHIHLPAGPADDLPGTDPLPPPDSVQWQRFLADRACA